MRLEKIVLDGFKSFADKTEFNFNQQITAIVGPNGCGKSNVVDALKWVLGEQSTKSLRSGQMADVIFSGSSSRKASARAQVSLHFSQTSAMGLETDELQITRTLYKNGDSEYLINNKPSRLKDIKQLFMDTGIGVKAYSIIEQGQIAQLLTASKQDRRAIFEEAAGVSKYKAQKKEALRKLERTEQNLLRLADIVGEVQKQLRSIKLQAGKARNYLEYSQRLKELRVSFSLAQYHQIAEDTKAKNQSLSEVQQQLASVITELSEKDAKVSELSTSIIDKETEINRYDNMLVAVKAKIEQQQQAIEFLKRRIEELNERDTAEQQQIAELTGHIGQLEGQLAESQNQQKEIETAVAEKTAALDEVSEIIREANLECAEIESQLDDEKTGIIDIVRRTAQLHNEIQSISVYRNNLHGQKNRLNDKASQATGQLEKMLSSKAQAQARLDDINKVIAELQEKLGEKREQIKNIDADVAATNEDLAHRREDRSAIQSELKVLADMEAKQQGIAGAVKQLLAMAKENDKSFVEGILADKLQVSAEYAMAIEAALENKTNAVIVSDSKLLLGDEQIAGQDSGRIRFICKDRLKSQTVENVQEDGVIGNACDIVSFEPENETLVKCLLGKTIIVNSIETAVKLSHLCQDGYRFVSIDGKLLENDGSICIGNISKAGGLISRKSRLTQLEENADQIKSQIEQLEEKIQNAVQQNEHLERLCKDFRTSVYEANTEKTNITSDLHVIEQNIKRLTDEQPILENEITQLEEQISQTVKNEYQSKQQLDELEQVNTQRQEKIDTLETLLAEKKETMSQSVSELTELKIMLGQSNEQKRSLTAQIQSLEVQIRNAKNTLSSSKNNIENCKQQIQKSQQDILSAEADITNLLEQKQQSQNQSVALHETLEILTAEKNELDSQLKILGQQQSSLDEKAHHIQLELSQLEVKSTDLIERVREELEMDLVNEYENYSSQDVDWDAVRKEIAELRGKIERLGNVNVDAIEQQDELEKRNEFLTAQIEDLNESKNQLTQLINKLNKESVDKFAQSFEEIRNNFQNVFRKLFGGGKADVIMENPEDILESGIEIIARPPGKETRSISLLSGGEKTMTAMALLFAIFQTKPSPFCFLDEVDAALDEANNERFNLIVQEFRKDSQFVIITHAKRTMSIADTLYGITMQTKGVSKRISVTFDKYKEPEGSDDNAAVA